VEVVAGIAEYVDAPGRRDYQQLRFAHYSWLVLTYNLLVILWGAYVRATGSGAGCGSHWPLCNGEVLPRAPRAETIIEFTHRLTSGMALISVVVLCIWAYRLYSRGHRVRTLGALSLVLILAEAALGAGLVLFQYVAGNASAARAVYLSAHLVNTQLLLGALALTAWYARPEPRPYSRLPKLFLAALAVTLIVSITGAVAALGDTLFPSSSISSGLAQDFAASSHALLRLRILHPMIAVIAGIYLVFCGVVAIRGREEPARRLGMGMITLVIVQLIAGGLNVVLLAPVWMQLVHLLIADMLWIVLILLSGEVSHTGPRLV
jgi:heme A synthase